MARRDISTSANTYDRVREVFMQRDWDCVRAILQALNETPNTTTELDPKEVSGFDEETVSFHIHLMIQARLVEGFCSEEIGRPLHCRAFYMTWEGYELLAKISSNTVWSRIKDGARNKGAMLSFDLVKFLAQRALQDLF
jgi:hypothetical protein